MRMSKARASSKSLVWNVGFLLLILAVGVVSYQFFKNKEGLADLDKATKISQKDGVVVFTMPECPHCESIKPDVKKLNKESNKFAVVEVGDPKSDEIIKQFEVNKYPTILQFKDGVPTVYEQDRSYASLKQLLFDSKQ
jgi:thiol-disulfide isomerase/thioredoxin